MEALEQAVAYLEGMNPDGTAVSNGVGWNKMDAGFGRSLAQQVGRWTPNQAAAAWRLVQKYRATQLAMAGIVLPPEPPDFSAIATRQPKTAYVEPPASVEVVGDRIAVKASFKYKDALKTIPGARWDGTGKAWTYPATPTVAQAIARVLGGQPQAATGKNWDALIAQAEREEKAAALRDHDGHDLDEIPGLAGESWPHQRAGYWWARERDAAMLTFRMRYGKTRTTVGLMRNLPGHPDHVHQILVLCPLSVVAVWPDEIRKHAPAWPVRIVALDKGSVAQKVERIERERTTGERQEVKPLVVIVNYDSARMEPLAGWLLKRHWDLVVLDESHRIKAPGGATSLFVAKLREKARKRVCLTGTPMPHSPLDIYAQYRFLDPGVFGTSFIRFRNRYAIMGGYGQHQVVGWRDTEELNRRVYTMAYRPPDDIVAMPAELHIERTCTLSAKALAVYTALEEDLYAEVEAGSITAANVLVQLLRLAQLAGGVMTLDDGTEQRIDDAKPALLRDVLEDLGDEVVVVMCRFHADLDAVHAQAAALGMASSELSGRRKELDAWQAGRTQVLAVQIQAGGVGINLSRADLMILYSVGYSLGDYDQALARIRVSGKPSVQYIHLTAAGTVDERIRKALEDRADLVEAALRRRDV